jgi:hypothetical protein
MTLHLSMLVTCRHGTEHIQCFDCKVNFYVKEAEREAIMAADASRRGPPFLRG